MQWLTVEVFDGESAAWAWRDRHADQVVTAALSAGARSWEWHEHRFGVAFEVAFRSEDALEAFRSHPALLAALDAAPDRLNGVLVYRGRGGGAGAGVPRRPRPRPSAGALALPEPPEEDYCDLAAPAQLSTTRLALQHQAGS